MDLNDPAKLFRMISQNVIKKITGHKILRKWDSNLGQKPEVFMPPSADKVTPNSSALSPHSNCQTVQCVDALLHELLCSAFETQTEDTMLQRCVVFLML